MAQFNVRFALVGVLLSSIPSQAASQPTSAVFAESNPIRKVVTLVQEMKVQVEKEADQDLASYDKYQCWCDTNEKEKTAAIKNAEEQIDSLNTFLNEAIAKKGELKTEIAGLAVDIADDQDALAEATGVRKKEHAAFEAEETDMKETRGLLGEAIEVLSKVQLTQKSSVGLVATNEAKSVLLQVHDVVQHRYPKFSSVMQKDLFDVLGSLQDMSQGNLRRPAAALEQTALLPWEKTEEQVGKEANPNDLKGAAANAKSYNSRSGQIVGILAEMRDEFSRDLGAAQKADFGAEVEFQKLRAAKQTEIEVATKQKERKEEQLADLIDKMAKANEDIASLETAMAADQSFLANLQKNCKIEDEQYAGRIKVRSEEIRALAETLKILTADDSRDLFGKTINLLQVTSSHEAKSAAARAASEDRATERAMERLAVVARKHGNWALVSLAARVRLDAFTQVKEMMDKMMVQLQNQQKLEYAKWELCKKDIDATEDTIKVGENTKEDLDEKHKDLSNTAETLTKSIAELKAEIAELEVSLKQAGEQRHEENQLFQSSVSDQRITVDILQKALARLKAFYATKGGFIQVSAHGQHNQVPGAASPPPPPRPSEYSKSAGAGGVIQLLMKVISDAQVTEQDLVMSEQKAQEIYASVAQDTTKSIEADRGAIEEKEVQLASTNTEKSETAEAQLSNDVELAKHSDLLKAHHLDCDFLLKYFDVRQTARAEEMDAITDANAILSGADFGK